MCRQSRSRPADTSVQDAEAARQREALIEQANLDRQLQQQLFQEQLAAEQARHNELLAAQQAEADRRYAAEQAAAEQFRQQNEAILAAQEAERANVERLAAERAQRATAYATARGDRVGAARDEINNAYSGFDDAYFDQFRQDYIGANKPQLDRAYRDTVRESRLDLADRGNLNSTAAAMFFGDLARTKAQKEAELAASAEASTRGFRNAIDSQRLDDLSSLTSSAFATQELPDGVTDLDTALSDLDAQIGLISGDARRRATNISRPGYGTLSTDFPEFDAAAFARTNQGTRVVGQGNGSNLPYGASNYAVGG